MRLFRRATDALLARFVPASTARAGCAVRERDCGWCSAGIMRCCYYYYGGCAPSCQWVNCGN